MQLERKLTHKEVKKRKQKQGSAKKKRKRQNSCEEEGYVECKKFKGPLMQMINVTRFVPTLQLFDALWRVAFHMISTVAMSFTLQPVLPS